ncbi:probable methionine--tRNA ligase, partial [Tanacetum coccineum]
MSKNESASGDQCDVCSKLLSLINPRSKVCPRICDTKHLFLELPLLEAKLREYMDKMSVESLMP